jgi:hypothetical protein
MIASNSCWLAAAIALPLLVPVAARADSPAAPPSEEQVEAARGIYKEARELYRQGRLKEALDKALEAYRIASTPVTALEVGQLLVESGRLVEARDILRGVSSMPISPRESDKGREARQQAATLAASLDARIPKLAVAGRPRGVDVLLDGKPLAAAEPSAWQGVDPGSHSVVVRSEERTCTSITVTLAEGEVRTTDLHDVAASCRAEAPPTEPERVPPAARPQESRGETPAPPPEGEHTSSSWKWVGLGVAGVGVAAVGIGGYLALKAKSDYDSVPSTGDAAGSAPYCSLQNICNVQGYDARNSARSQADVATVMMAAGGAVAVGGIVMWLLAPSSGGAQSSSDVGRPRIAIGPGSVALSVRLR